MKLKDRVASGLGSTLEWYDFALYGYFAPIIAQTYFPTQNKITGLISVFSIFAIGFVARPIGALVFGVVSDKYGRACSLKFTPLLIAMPTFFISILPGYESIGIFAPIMMLVFRVIQGLCIGGEYANNLIYLCESALSKNMFFMGSIASCTGSAGILIASTIATICNLYFSSDILFAWGWRLPFGASLLIGLLTYYLRVNMHESQVYVKLISDCLLVNNPFRESIKRQKKDYLMCVGLLFLPATSFYYAFTFLPNFLGSIAGHATVDVLGNNSMSLLIRLFMIPLIGLVADKIGGLRIARMSCVLFIIFSYPIMYGILNLTAYAWMFAVILAMFTSLNAATTPALLIGFLAPQTRSTIFSFSFNACFGILGGLVPLIGLFLVEISNSNITPTYYLIFSAFVTFTATFFYRKSIYEKF